MLTAHTEAHGGRSLEKTDANHPFLDICFQHLSVHYVQGKSFLRSLWKSQARTAKDRAEVLGTVQSPVEVECFPWGVMPLVGGAGHYQAHSLEQVVFFHTAQI